MRILVSGGGGRVARALDACCRRHALRTLTRAELDVTDLAAARAAVAAYEPDVIINAAAFTGVDAAESCRDDAYAVNALGARNLAMAAAESDRPVVQLSSDYVFDGAKSSPYVESDAPAPLSVYGASKLEGEREVASANPRHYIVRTSWLYDAESRNFATAIASSAEVGAAEVVDDQWGSPTYVPHLAEAILELIGTERFGTYHLAGRGGASWFELAQALFAAMGVQAAIHPVPSSRFPRPARRPRYSVLATEREPPIELPPWREGVAEFAKAARRLGDL